ncbi:MAG: hypothetical protein M0T79_09725 [Actinomycetota bacterium]|nr:hypothetical protein [Actinomycetota bacterium]
MGDTAARMKITAPSIDPPTAPWSEDGPSFATAIPSAITDTIRNGVMIAAKRTSKSLLEARVLSTNARGAKSTKM